MPNNENLKLIAMEMTHISTESHGKATNDTRREWTKPEAYQKVDMEGEKATDQILHATYIFAFYCMVRNSSCKMCIDDGVHAIDTIWKWQKLNISGWITNTDRNTFYLFFSFVLRAKLRTSHERAQQI